MRRVFDENGHEIHPYSVLKVFHFIGARRKRHYMYKWVKDGPELKALHLDDDKGGGYWLFGQTGPDMRIKGTEVVQCSGPCCNPWKAESGTEGSPK